MLLVVLAVVCVGGMVVLFRAWQLGVVRLPKSLVAPAQTSVISWNPGTATLIYLENGTTKQQVIKPLRPMVVVPIFADGKLVREELALVPQAEYWNKAFCSGDIIQLTYASASGEITEIRNKGPRQCD